MSYLDNKYPAEIPVLSPLKSPYKVKASSDEVLLKGLDKIIYENFAKNSNKNTKVNLTEEPESPVALNLETSFNDIFEIGEKSSIKEIPASGSKNNTSTASPESVWDNIEEGSNSSKQEKNLHVTSVKDKKILKQALKKEYPKYYSSLGYYRSSQDANKIWSLVKSSNKKLLAGYEPKIIKTKKDNSFYYELLVGPYDEFKIAKSMCKKIIFKNQKCMVSKKEV